jgi:hypothetical protein
VKHAADSKNAANAQDSSHGPNASVKKKKAIYMDGLW